MKIFLGNSNKLYCPFKKLYLSSQNIQLLSSDNYILKDSNGLYLTVKEGK